MKYITAFVLFFVFAAASIAAPFVALFAILTGQFRYAGNITHSEDMTLAALIAPLIGRDWNGRSTVSKECGRDLDEPRPCRFCRVLCAVLDKILEPGHCRKEASE